MDPQKAAQLVLVRHGETDWNAEQRLQVGTFALHPCTLALKYKLCAVCEGDEYLLQYTALPVIGVLEPLTYRSSSRPPPEPAASLHPLHTLAVTPPPPVAAVCGACRGKRSPALL